MSYNRDVTENSRPISGGYRPTWSSCRLRTCRKTSNPTAGCSTWTAACRVTWAPGRWPSSTRTWRCWTTGGWSCSDRKIGRPAAFTDGLRSPAPSTASTACRWWTASLSTQRPRRPPRPPGRRPRRPRPARPPLPRRWRSTAAGSTRRPPSTTNRRQRTRTWRWCAGRVRGWRACRSAAARAWC